MLIVDSYNVSSQYLIKSVQGSFVWFITYFIPAFRNKIIHSNIVTACVIIHYTHINSAYIMLLLIFVIQRCYKRWPQFLFSNFIVQWYIGPMTWNTYKEIHVVIANPWWRGKRSQHSRRMRNPQVQPASLRIWQEAHGKWSHCFTILFPTTNISSRM